MRATTKYILNDLELPDSRKRLLNDHLRLGSWERVAEDKKINFRYIWEYAVKGKLPRNPIIRRKLIGHPSINQHLAQDRIQEMPPPLLKWALENRIPME